MTKPLHVVIFVGAAPAPDQIFRSAFGGRSPAEVLSMAAGREVTVSLVHRGTVGLNQELLAVHAVTQERQSIMDRALGKLHDSWIEKLLRRRPVGRLVISMGPTDPSRIAWRAVRADSQAMALLTSADVVIAADLAAVRTAWHLVQRGTVAHSYFGLKAAEKIFVAKFRGQS